MLVFRLQVALTEMVKSDQGVGKLFLAQITWAPIHVKNMMACLSVFFFLCLALSHLHTLKHTV